MDCRTHERGVGMLNTPYVKKDTIKNFFPVPNAVFDLGLHHMEISIYAYLLRIEDRRTYQCIVSYPTIAKKLGISVNTVAKYVAALEEHGLIRTEHTEIITKDGHKRNGCLRYTILPIEKEALYQAISALPTKSRSLVQSLFFEGLSEYEYADMLGVSRAAIHKRKMRILRVLKKTLRKFKFGGC